MRRLRLVWFCFAVACSTAGGSSGGGGHRDGGSKQDGGASLPDLASLDGALPIPKTGAAYNGVELDPGLDVSGDCTDAVLEPNNVIANATHISSSVAVNAGGRWIEQQAICPKGRDDIDFFLIDTTGAVASTIYLMAEIRYDIEYGDLDVAIVNDSGEVLASDGTATANGCVVSKIGFGRFYVGVRGAAGAVNNYQVRVRTFSSPQTCPGL